MAAHATVARRSAPSPADAASAPRDLAAARAAATPVKVDGRIALTIGVTGHRRLATSDLPLYRQRIAALFDDLHRRYPHTSLRVLSPLAEGADRLPVEIALERGYEVIAILPLAIADYERDFDDRVPAFRALLDRLRPENVFELPTIAAEGSFASPGDPDRRDAHYQQAGDFVAAHCHVLLALWDGVANDLPGGTGEVVHYKLTGRGPFTPSTAELIELPDGGPVAWLRVRRDETVTPPPDDTAVGSLQWLYPEDRKPAHFQRLFGRIDEFNGVPARRRLGVKLPSSIAGSSTVPLDHEQRTLARTFETADALSIHYRKIGDRVLKVLIALGIVMTLAYETYSRFLPVRAMLGLYLGAFALVCGVYLWHRSVGALQKHLDYRALAEGLRVRFFWSLAGIRTSVTDIYLRKQNDELQWIREALRPCAPPHGRAFEYTDLVFKAWVADQVRYFGASARRLGKTGRWAKLASLGFFAVGLVKTAVLFVLWDHLQATGALGHWSLASVGSLPIVGALIDSLSDSMGYSARAKQHAILAGIFARAESAYAALLARGGDETDNLRALLEGLGTEALFENEDWLTLRRDRPMVLPPEAAGR